MRDLNPSLTFLPQFTHKFSRRLRTLIVNKLCINFMLLHRNEGMDRVFGVYGSRFLPTMKSQLSQLP